MGVQEISDRKEKCRTLCKKKHSAENHTEVHENYSFIEHNCSKCVVPESLLVELSVTLDKEPNDKKVRDEVAACV
jgi:hypothetical protein